MSKIILNGLNSHLFCNFRSSFIKKLVEEKNEVYIICTDDIRKDEILGYGVRDVYVVPIVNNSLNPFSIIKYKKKLANTIQMINPDVVISFMMKPSIYGSQVAKKCGVKNIYAMIEGMGRVFTFDTFVNKMIRMYIKNQFKKAFKNINKLFVLNKDDKKFFINNGIVNENRMFLLNGIGVELDKYSFSDIPQQDIFLMIARLIEEKGVYDFCKAAEIVKKEYSDVRFCLLGSEDSITKMDIAKFPAVEYLGTSDNVSSIIDDCSVFVLPSVYKEGLPRSIMEAMSKGRPIITTNTNGCKDMVEEGVNGFIVPMYNSNALADAMKKLAGNKDLQKSMGQSSRKMAEERYDSIHINNIFYEQIKINM